MKKTFIIAEAGVNHNGSLNNALKLVDIAHQCDANAVKFQTFKADLLVSEDTPKADYQTQNTGNSDTQYNMLKKLELSFDDYQEIKNYCDKLNLEFISTPFDVESVKFLDKLDVHRFKIGSGDLTNYQLLKAVSLTQKPIILSTGMSNLDEVVKAVNYLKKYTKSHITVLHCVSNYPTDIHETNLLAIKTLKEKLNLDIGFSDHTLKNDAAMISVSLGATCLEKHFTIDKTLDGPDHKASLSPDELKEYVKKIRETEIMLGNKIKKCQPSEVNTKKLVRRSIAINKDMNKDDIINEEDIICLRPDTGISSIHFEYIIGRKLNKNISKNTFLQWSDFDVLSI